MKNKKIWYWVLAAVFIAWVAFRIFVIASESARVVFNPARSDAISGAPVESITVNKKTDVLHEPLAIKNNRAFISCGRINKFKVGQVVGSGRIVSVSNRIDLDSGMCIVKTNNVADGSTFAESKYTGYFIPVYAVRDNVVLINKNSVAVQQVVKTLASDSENSVVSDLHDGDVVIISNIDNGTKVK